MCKIRRQNPKPKVRLFLTPDEAAAVADVLRRAGVVEEKDFGQLNGKSIGLLALDAMNYINAKLLIRERRNHEDDEPEVFED